MITLKSFVLGSLGGASLLASVACGGAAAPKQAPTPVESQPSAAPAPQSTWEPPPLPTDDPKGAIALLGGISGPEKAWDTMSHDEKEWYMVGKVHPIMRQVFQTFDQARYEGDKFECAPCHEPNFEVTKYKMPNPKLSPVPAFGSADWKAMENARIVKFMQQRVTPVMAQLLGHDPNDASQGDAVTCYACHPKS
ncbi:MAG: hypothetical protein QM778_33775 [Myxococcales bacterium]